MWFVLHCLAWISICSGENTDGVNAKYITCSLWGPSYFVTWLSRNSAAKGQRCVTIQRWYVYEVYYPRVAGIKRDLLSGDVSSGKLCFLLWVLSLVTLDNMWKSWHYWFLITKTEFTWRWYLNREDIMRPAVWFYLSLSPYDQHIDSPYSTYSFV